MGCTVRSNVWRAGKDIIYSFRACKQRCKHEDKRKSRLFEPPPRRGGDEIQKPVRVRTPSERVAKWALDGHGADAGSHFRVHDSTYTGARALATRDRGRLLQKGWCWWSRSLSFTFFMLQLCQWETAGLSHIVPHHRSNGFRAVRTESEKYLALTLSLSLSVTLSHQHLRRTFSISLITALGHSVSVTGCDHISLGCVHSGRTQDQEWTLELDNEKERREKGISSRVAEEKEALEEATYNF